MDKQLILNWTTREFKAMFSDPTSCIEHIVETEKYCRRSRRYCENSIEVTANIEFIVKFTIWESPEGI